MKTGISHNYISHRGSSITDYFIMSRCLVHLGLHLSIVPKTDSKHTPVKISLKLPSTVSGTDAKPKMYGVQKYIWNAEKAQQYFIHFHLMMFLLCLKMLLV